jgi:hypothetical protein
MGLIALVVFLPWVNGYFMGDDWMLFARNSGRALPDELRMLSDTSNSRFYRPLYDGSLVWAWQVFGWDTVAHQVVNFLLHALNTVLVTVLTRRMSGRWFVALVAGLVFATLGCHTEPVVWITARHEMIVTALALGCTLSYVKFRANGGWLYGAAAVALYVTSIGFKETALAVPLALACYDLLFTLPRRGRPPQWRLRLGEWIPLLVMLGIVIVYTLYRLQVGGGYPVRLSALTIPKNLVYYLLMELLALPASTDFIGHYPLVILSTMAVLGVVLLVLVWLARRQVGRERSCVMWFGAAWMVIALAPVILIVAERTTYVSSVGMALMLGALAGLAWDDVALNGPRWRKGLVAVVVVALVGANLVVLMHRSASWRQTADVSRDLIAQVRATLHDMPADRTVHVWFFDMPFTIEYAYAFGNRALFAMWLLDDPRISARLFESGAEGASLAERVDRVRTQEGTQDAIVAFAWSQGRLVRMFWPAAQR